MYKGLGGRKPWLSAGEAEEKGGPGQNRRDQDLRSWKGPPLVSHFIDEENDAHFAQSG